MGYQKKLPVSLDCGLNLFIEVLSGKWKIPLVWSIHSGIKRPGELHRKIAKASRRVLDTQLKELTNHGILQKIDYNVMPLKVEYELTPLGMTLLPVIALTAEWGEQHREELEALILSGN